MTIFTVSEEVHIHSIAEIDFGDGGEHDVEISVYEQVELDVTDHDISTLCPSEARELDSVLTAHFPSLREITKDDVVIYLAENLHELGDIIDNAVSIATTPPLTP